MVDDKTTSTIAVDKETHQLIRQYCFIHRIDIKEFVEKMTHEKMEPFKKQLNELRKLRIY